jgi:hypothetical protein
VIARNAGRAAGRFGSANPANGRAIAGAVYNAREARRIASRDASETYLRLVGQPPVPKRKRLHFDAKKIFC